MTQSWTLNVNGRSRSVEVEGTTPLLDVLRNGLGLKAARFGCGLEQCGACKVLIDGEALPSCRVGVEDVAGSRIVTVEGLSDGTDLHPIQEAFLAEQAAQCGFCTAGLVIGVKALLDRHPNPTDAEIREALDIHVCRCGIHHRVIRAVHRAAKALAR